MKLSRRSYPYPVVGNLDDVPGAAFQAVQEASNDKVHFYLNVSIQCSSKTIASLVAKHRAVYVVHVECTNTMFRRRYEFSEPTTKINIPVDRLNDAVEVNVFVVAAQNISNYSVEDAHPDYENAKFEVRKGDILAVGEGRVYYVENNQDALGRIGTILVVDAASVEGDQPMQLDFSGDKIRVVLSKPDHATYQILRNNQALLNVVAAAIVLPALVEALHYIDESSESTELESLKWYRVLTRKMEELGLKKGDAILNVQRLLELPIKRAFVTADKLAEAGS